MKPFAVNRQIAEERLLIWADQNGSKTNSININLHFIQNRINQSLIPLTCRTQKKRR